jgi:hypothetical protein
VTQGAGSEFKPQYRKKIKIKIKFYLMTFAKLLGIFTYAFSLANISKN